MLSVGALTMPVRIGLGPLVLFLFSCIGIYLASARHNTARLFARSFYVYVVAYAIWSLGLILYRGEPILDNRQIGYVALLAVFAFAAPGMVLVRDPLRAYVLGSRIGVVLAAAAAAGMSLFVNERVGIGGNAAVFAFVSAVGAISAAIPLRNAPRWLPNGPQWLVLGIVAAMASGTRAVIVVLPLFALAEIVIHLRRCSVRQQIYAIAGAVVAVIAVAGPATNVLSDRFTGMIEYYDTGDSTKWEDKFSADIRLAMWRGAATVISQAPIVGVGASAKMDMVREAAGPQGHMLDGFRHVHNTLLDELLNDGVVGLALLLAAFFSIFAYLWRAAAEAGMRRALIYFVIVGISYGMLHNPLLHEMTISSIMFFIAALNATATSRLLARRCALAPGALTPRAGLWSGTAPFCPSSAL
ncbi:O-antigen ligase family protein [Mesorhizobium sp. PUT5]|uniref:O-antigen ligase family protein n=1 Tax=Mesorhizobium sp. PUT5 TaxID=3454629 RepID=UPI003FA45273